MGCDKKFYAKKFIAKAASKRIKATGNKTKLTPYRCDNCGGWHLTSMRGDEITITRKVKRLISEFKVGQIWFDDKGSFEVVKEPDNAKGLAQILDNMRKDERKL